MKNRKSGWSGKVKVAMAIAFTVIFSLLIVQCNSKLEEQVPDEEAGLSESNFAEVLHLPVLPDKKDPIVLDLKDALNFSIAGNRLTIDGEEYRVEEIISFIEKKRYSEPVAIRMNIDKDQTMKFIGDIQMELRKADQRKVVYLGETTEGAKVEIPLLLPPFPYSKYGENVPSNDELSAAGFDVFKIDMGSNTGSSSQKKVYDFVKSHIKKQSSDYVVSGVFDDEDPYSNYLVNLIYMKAGFNQIYQERAQRMFGKDYHEIDKEEHKAVREGVPMAISIADQLEKSDE